MLDQSADYQQNITHTLTNNLCISIQTKNDMNRFQTIIFGGFLFCFTIPLAWSQTDTLRLTLPQIQQEFVQKNLSLLAQKYNVESQKAQIIQARLLPNPNVAIQQGLLPYKAQVNDVVVGPFGQHAFMIQQLILLAGKRNKNVQLAQANADMSQYAFYDLLRTLSYTLRSEFYKLTFQLRTMTVYKEEIQTISRLVNAYKELNRNGNAPLKDVARLESFQFSLQTSLNNIELNIAQNEADLRTLLGISTNVFLWPILDESELEQMSLNNRSLDSLIELAQNNRADLKLQEASLRFADANIALQKSLKVPDLNLLYTYDNAGGYTNYYHGLTVSMNLPFFSKNQGNIKTAILQKESNQKSYEQVRVQVANDVIAAYNQVNKAEQLYRSFDRTFVSTFSQLIAGVMEGYQKKTISLVEFMDFFDSYKQNIEQLNNFQNDRVQAYNQLNFVVGKALN